MKKLLAASIIMIIVFASFTLCAKIVLKSGDGVVRRWKIRGDVKVLADGSIKLTCSNRNKKNYCYSYAGLKVDNCYILTCKYRSLDNFKAATLQIKFNFQEKNGLNGSAGQKIFVLKPLTTQKVQTFKVFLEPPQKTESCQVVIAAVSQGSVVVDKISIAEQKNKIRIFPAAKAPIIDGRLNEPCWKNAQPLTVFYNLLGGPAKVQTVAYVTYDNNNLYFAFENQETEMSKLKISGSAASGTDARVFSGDCNELFLCSPNNIKLHFISNAAGGKFDGMLLQHDMNDQYYTNSKWNGNWEVSGSKTTDRWITEFKIPFKTFDTSLQKGKTWRINLARERKFGVPENSHWNKVKTGFRKVEQYAKLTFHGNHAELKRYLEPKTSIGYIPKREKQTFKANLSQKKGNYNVLLWCCGYNKVYYNSAIRDKYTSVQWEKQQDNFLQAMIDGDFIAAIYPWAPNYINNLEKWCKAGLKGWSFMHCSSVDGMAQRLGCKLNYDKKHSDVINKYYQQAALKIIKKSCSSPWKKYINILSGKDEPTNGVIQMYSTVCHPENAALLKTISAEIKKDYGFGKYGLPDFFGEKSQATPFERIAFWCWWNAKLHKNFVEQYQLCKKLCPAIPAMMLNLNFCSRISRASAMLAGDTGDYVGCDPYPTSAAVYGGRARGLYHTGFSVKYLKDLVDKAKILTYCQGFIYKGGKPDKAMIREWASQAMKNGTDILAWYGSGPANYTMPESFKELLRVSNIVRHMNKIKLPKKHKDGCFLFPF